MASAQLNRDQREGAEVYHGAEACKNKSLELLAELHLPKGLLPLTIDELGYNRANGFVWLKQSRATSHVFKKIGKTVSYAEEVTAVVEDRRMRHLTGVKSKELLIWVGLGEISVDEGSPSKVTFKSNAGLGKSFPLSAFEDE